jgi:glycosyltransferase involved in cell wall biosynthesis
MKIKHAVVMVTYNHEKYISEALDSIFNNKILPDEIILLDDCSTDKTCDIIQNFKIKYPDILNCKSNIQNLGIYKNINNMWEVGKKCSSDIISCCSGDDFLYPGLFEELNRVVEENKINLQSDFIIITNSSELYPDGEIKIIDNCRFNRFNNRKNIIKARIRYQLDYREIGFSRALVHKVDPLRDDIGLSSDLLMRLDFEMKCKDFYFTQFIASCYRMNVGICIDQLAKEIPKWYQSKIDIYNELINNNKYRSVLDRSDMNFLKMEYHGNQILSKSYTLKDMFLYFYYLILSTIQGESIKKYHFYVFIPTNIRKFIKSLLGK